MRIVVDLQAIQSPANGARGIGRYTSSLIEAMLRRSRGHEWVFALNGRFADSVDTVRDRFHRLADSAAFRVWAPPSSTRSTSARRAAERLYEAFLASLRPDVVHVASLFEGHYDECVTSIATFVRQPTSVTLYDLIPLLYSEIYLAGAEMRGWYMRKIEALKRADLWLAISESSRREGIAHLGLDARRCINVSTAAADHFVPISVPQMEEQELRARYGLHKPYVMYTGGVDHRKNIEGLVRAFAMLPRCFRALHQLAVVCSIRQEDRDRLLALAVAQGLEAQDLVLTGYVPERDLIRLYNLCTLFVFPSRHEGFGLPALEAMSCGAAVLASNTSSLPEVVGRADALFDPDDDGDIAKKMAQALEDRSFLADLQAHGRRQAKLFSWDESAKRALDALESVHEANRRATAYAAPAAPMRPRLAFVSPLPPERSGIAGYSAELLPALAKHYEIYLITDLSGIGDPVLAASFPVRSTTWFRNNPSFFDRVVYQFGDSTFHSHMFELLALIPGVVVLHDFFLSNIHGYREFVDQEPHVWTRALYHSHGYAGAIDRFGMAAVELGKKYPVNLAVVEQSLGVIVHSEFSRQLAQRWYGHDAAKEWTVVPLTRATHVSSPRERIKARQILGISPDEFVVCSFGLLGPAKLNERLLDAWLASTMGGDRKCRLLFVGENDSDLYGIELQRRIQQDGHNVRITGWADDNAYQHYLAAADVAVQLRAHSRGESSAALLDAMNRGLAVIANANGSMSTLPTDAVRLLPDAFTQQQLIDALQWMHEQRDARLQLGERARRIIATEHSPMECARQYAHALESAASRAAHGPTGLARAIGYLDPPPRGTHRDEELAEIAKAIGQSLPAPRVQRQILVDVSAYVHAPNTADAAFMEALKAALERPAIASRIEPVYATTNGPKYLYAREFTLRLLGLPAGVLEDDLVEPREGDIIIAAPDAEPDEAGLLRKLRHMGVKVLRTERGQLARTLRDVTDA